MKKYLIAISLLLSVLPAMAQVDRHDVRAGNRKFRKGEIKEAEIDYRKAVLKDSTSVAGQYNLASSLYRQEDYEGASKALGSLDPVNADWYYNQGDAAIQRKDWKAAVEALEKSLILSPDDLDAKENYIYARLMLQNQQNGGGGGQDQNQNQDQDQNQDQNQDQDQDQDQDQNQDQDQDQNQDQNQDQDQNQNQDQDQDQNQDESGMSRQEAQQMLRAIQAKEKETQDKVKKEKAAILQSRQKEKNW